ncbi:leishmanolysin [Trypanosoma rangeli]|uniref:Leishmanolysin n=1 Tax=Trypanosoma rangeli TaxID=5698 RepID=A0A422MW31_TRYRA|nr:leishmanolysin [Trypanosoma rangeli]RNE97361.1 leishmanolysin [Trypanosoma rangeli]|eukprot:RNE97361.1 leishmanolysin [Trypanosoma rangeli]
MFKRKQHGQFIQAMCQPRRSMPFLPLAVFLLLLVCCAGGCLAVAPARKHRWGFDEMIGGGGRRRLRWCVMCRAEDRARCRRTPSPHKAWGVSGPRSASKCQRRTCTTRRGTVPQWGM